MKLPKEPLVTLGGADAKGYCPVRIRVSFNSQRKDLYVGFTVLESQWNPEKGRVKQGCTVKGVQYNILNDIIKDRLAFVQQYFTNALLRNDETISLNDLYAQYDAKYGKSQKEQSEEFFFLLDSYIAERSKERRWSSSYKGQWETMRNDWMTYKPNIKFSDLSKRTLNGYVEYLAQRMVDDKIAEYLKKLREFINYVSKKGYLVHKEFYDFKPKLLSRQKTVDYLTKEELQKLIDHDFSSRPSLDRVRDMCVFQACTSLRWSDMKQLTREKIHQVVGGGYELMLVTEKDNGKVWFRLSKEAERIYLKYANNIYKNDWVFPIISDTKYREYLSEVGMAIGLEGEVVDYNFVLGKKVQKIKPRYKMGTHIGRRTFIVHAINGGASPEKVSLFTSHADVEQMLPYITLTEQGKEDVLEIINDLTK